MERNSNQKFGGSTTEGEAFSCTEAAGFYVNTNKQTLLISEIVQSNTSTI